MSTPNSSITVTPDEFPYNLEYLAVAAVPFCSAVLSLIIVVLLYKKLNAAPRGEDLDLPGKGDLMNELSDTIQEGAK